MHTRRHDQQAGAGKFPSQQMRRHCRDAKRPAEFGAGRGFAIGPPVCCYGIKGSALAWTDVRPAAHSSSP